MVMKLFPGYEMLLQIASFLLDISNVSPGDIAAKVQQNSDKQPETDSFTKRTLEIIKPVITTAFFYLNDKISEEQYQTFSELLPEEVRGPSKKEHLKQKEQIVSLQREVLSNVSSIDGLNTKVISQCEELEEKTNKIASLEVDILTKKMQICCLKSTNDSQTEKIGKLKQKIEEFEEKVNSLGADIAEKSREITTLTCDMETLSNDVESKTTEVLSLSAELIEKTNQIAQMENERTSDNEDKQKELESLCAEIDSWKVLVEVRDKEVTMLRSEAQKREEEIEDKDNSIANLMKNIQSKEAIISRLKTQQSTALDKNRYGSRKSDELFSDLSSTISLE